MLYAFFKVLMSMVLRVYVRKIESYGLDTVPGTGALIISANHPNSLLDAVILSVMVGRRLHFLSRSDVFNTSFKRWFLNSLGLIPVYRIRDGRQNLNRNNEAFTRCYEILDKGGAILIFSEGNCVVEKHLRPLKLGTAQLAIGFCQQFDRTLQVSCIGLTYSDPLNFRTRVKLSCSEPISISALDGDKQVMELTSHTAAKLRENMVHVEQKEDEVRYEPVEREQEAVRATFGWHSKLQVRPPEFKLIAQLQQDRYDIPATYPQAFRKESKTFQFLVLIIGSPFLFIGYLFNLPVSLLTSWLIKAKVKQEEFIGSVKMAGGMLVCLLYYMGGDCFDNYSC